MSFLPVRSVLRVEVTCRRLRNLLRHPIGSPECLWQGFLSRHWPHHNHQTAGAAADAADAADAATSTSGTTTGRSNTVGSSITSTSTGHEKTNQDTKNTTSRKHFLHLRHLRLRPLASTSSFSPRLSSSTLSLPGVPAELPSRTPSLRSVPQIWHRRKSPFAPRSEAGLVVPLAAVEECEVDVEPVGLSCVQAVVARGAAGNTGRNTGTGTGTGGVGGGSSSGGSSVLLERYNVAILESTNNGAGSNIYDGLSGRSRGSSRPRSLSPSSSGMHRSSFLPGCTVGPAGSSRSGADRHGFEVDFELRFAGWDGGLLGIVACHPTDDAEVSAKLDCPSRIFCFDLTPNGHRREFEEGWWHRSRIFEDGHRCPIICNSRQGGRDGILTKEESPTNTPRRFRLQFESSGSSTSSGKDTCRLEVFLLGRDGNSIVRKVGSIGGDSVSADSENRDDNGDDDHDPVARMRKYISDGCDVQPFVGFSPMDRENRVHLDPESKSFARVIRVVYHM